MRVWLAREFDGRIADERLDPGDIPPLDLIGEAAGGVDHDAIVCEAEVLFGHLKPFAEFTHAPGSFATGERREFKALEQVHFALGLESPGYQSDDIYTAQIFSTAFGGGMSSRLFQEVREKRGLCYTIYAQTGAHAETGMTTIYAGTSADDINELAGITLDELKRAAHDMSDAEVERARVQMKAGMLMGLESPSSRAERLARMISIWGRVPDLDETVQKIEAVTTRQVRDHAAKMASGNIALAQYGPVENALDLDAVRARLAA